MGLQPPWAETREDGGFIDARTETVAEKRSFSTAMASVESTLATVGSRGDDDENAPAAGRCLVPADGYYEWGDTEDGRQPYRLRLPDGDLFAMAGLWIRWRPERRQSGLGEFGGGPADEDDQIVETFATLTTTANDAVGDVHDRMPVVLAPDEEGDWLTADGDRTSSILDPYDGEMEVYAVSDAVNDPANDDPSVVESAPG